MLILEEISDSDKSVRKTQKKAVSAIPVGLKCETRYNCCYQW